MNSDERIVKIENTLEHIAEVHARIVGELERNSQESARNTSAIRDLVVVSRTLIETQKAIDVRLDRMGEEFQAVRRSSNEDFNFKLSALGQAQQETERKLQAWIEGQGH
jgi:hypothetical protein